MINRILTWLRSSGPTWHYKRIWLDALLLTVVMVAAAWYGFAKMGFSQEAIFTEDGPIEDLQSASLGITALLSIMAASRTRLLSRYVAIAIACIAIVFFMREMPICRGDMTYCVSKTWQPIIIAATVLTLLVATVIFERAHRGGILNAMHPRLSWPLAYTALVLGVSQLAEHFDIVVIEEGIESYGFNILLLGAAWLFRFSRTRKVEPLRIRAWHGLHRIKNSFARH